MLHFFFPSSIVSLNRFLKEAYGVKAKSLFLPKMYAKMWRTAVLETLKLDRKKWLNCQKVKKLVFRKLLNIETKNNGNDFEVKIKSGAKQAQISSEREKVRPWKFLVTFIFTETLIQIRAFEFEPPSLSLRVRAWARCGFACWRTCSSFRFSIWRTR